MQTATRYLQNLFEYGLAPLARYTLLITPDTGYLWFASDAVLHDAAPALTFPMAGIVQHYLPGDAGGQPAGDPVLEAIVKQWLADLSAGLVVDDELTEGLREADFIPAVRDGLVDAHVPA